VEARRDHEKDIPTLKREDLTTAFERQEPVQVRCEVRQKGKTASEAQNWTTSPAEENPPKGSVFLTMLTNK
jgi:hypothetical protein